MKLIGYLPLVCISQRNPVLGNNNGIIELVELAQKLKMNFLTSLMQFMREEICDTEEHPFIRDIPLYVIFHPCCKPSLFTLVSAVLRPVHTSPTMDIMMRYNARCIHPH